MQARNVASRGSERLRTGIDLLNEGKGKKLFISGVHPGLTLEHVVGNHPVNENLRSCCIVLGHDAESTQGNAEETQSWLVLENYHSLRLVTANYHMPRSLVEMRRRMPDVVLVPHPVFAERVILDQWWQWPGTATLLASEFQKYLFALARFRVEAWWDRLAVQFAGRAG